MIRWEHIKNIKIKETEAEARSKVKFLEKLGGYIYLFIIIAVLSSKYFKFGERISILLVILPLSAFLLFTIKYRKYYISLMEKSKQRSSWFYEDYSWKDSFTILFLLVTFTVLFVAALLKFFPLLEKLM